MFAPLNIKVALKKEPSSHFFKSAVACRMSNWFWCAYCPDAIMCQVYRESIKSSKISLEAKIQPVNIETSSRKWPLQTWMKSVRDYAFYHCGISQKIGKFRTCTFTWVMRKTLNVRSLVLYITGYWNSQLKVRNAIKK